jgi:hypothetical protein
MYPGPTPAPVLGRRRPEPPELACHIGEDCAPYGETGFSSRTAVTCRRGPNFAVPYSIGYLPPRHFNVYETGLHNRDTQSQQTLRRQSATGTVLASRSAGPAQAYALADALPRVVLGFADLSFLILSGRRVGNRSSCATCPAKFNSASWSQLRTLSSTFRFRFTYASDSGSAVNIVAYGVDCVHVLLISFQFVDVSLSATSYFP